MLTNKGRKINISPVLLIPGFLYIARSCWLFLAIYLLQITRLIFTPITSIHLFLKPVIGVYIFGISGVDASLSAYPGNNRLAKWG